MKLHPKLTPFFTWESNVDHYVAPLIFRHESKRIRQNQNERAELSLLNAVKRPWKISLLVLAGCVGGWLIYFLFAQPAKDLAPSLIVRSVRSPVYNNESRGTVLLTLTNGSGREIFFPIGGGFPGFRDVQLVWHAIEVKREDRWITEWKAKDWAQSNMYTAISANGWQNGKAADFRISLPADGKPRRIVLKWHPTPAKPPLAFPPIRYLWFKWLRLKQFKFAEVRSSEMVVLPGAPWYDFESAAKQLHSNEYRPTNEFKADGLESFGLNYSDSRKQPAKPK